MPTSVTFPTTGYVSDKVGGKFTHCQTKILNNQIGTYSSSNEFMLKREI